MRFVAERMSTPLVARDMLSIVEALGQDKLQYWGISYVFMSLCLNPEFSKSEILRDEMLGTGVSRVQRKNVS